MVLKEKIPNPLAKKQTGQDAGKGLQGSKNSLDFEPKPSTEQAKQWDGFGTALKPAVEPIISEARISAWNELEEYEDYKKITENNEDDEDINGGTQTSLFD